MSDTIPTIPITRHELKRTVEALPFSNEGYNRAKTILMDKYGEESEIVKAYMHVHVLTSLLCS